MHTIKVCACLKTSRICWELEGEGGRHGRTQDPINAYAQVKHQWYKHRTSAQMAYPNQEQQSWMHILRPTSKFQKLSHIHQ